MSYTLLTKVVVVEAGVALAPSAGDTGNGNSFDNSDGDVFAYLENSHMSSAETFTFPVQNASHTVDGWGPLVAADIVVVVPAASKALVGPFPKSAYNDAGGLVRCNFAGSGTPKIAAVKITGLVKG